MARQPEIQYINAGVCGTSAYKLDAEPVRKKRAQLPKARRQKKTVVYLDPYALIGILAAGVMMIMLLVGVVRLQESRNEVNSLEHYVQTLHQENMELQDTFEAGYDLEEIKQIAMAMGMVPADQVERVPLNVTVPVEEPQPTAWESFCAFLAGLFA